MPLIDVEVRLRELGRIRTGVTIEGEKDGKKFRRPEKLSTFRLTSPSASLIAAAKEQYGGDVQPWESPAGPQWELVTTVDSFPIVIPAGESLSQWYELWSAGGCQRRCDGRTETLSDSPCLCPADPAERRELAAQRTPQACKPTTRLNVVLPDLPDLGVWRLESHGYYAAVELAGAAQFLAMASSSGMNIPARLRLDQRTKKIPGKPTNHFAVPVIEFTTTRITDLLNAGAGPMMLGDAPPAPQLAAGTLVPERTKRTRGPRVERPALGPAPDVPDGGDFGRREPVSATAPGLPTDVPATRPTGATPPAAPEPSQTPVEPASIAGGWPVVDELPPTPPPAVKRPRKGDQVVPPTPLSADQLRDQIQSLPPERMGHARAVFERRFPNVKSLSELDDDQRGRYWHELTTQQGASSAA